VVQNFAPLDTFGAKYCPFGNMWRKILPLWIHTVQNIAPLDTCGAKYCPFG
jgi:hypothetical protein